MVWKQQVRCVSKDGLLTSLGGPQGAMGAPQTDRRPWSDRDKELCSKSFTGISPLVEVAESLGGKRNCLPRWEMGRSVQDSVGIGLHSGMQQSARWGRKKEKTEKRELWSFPTSVYFAIIEQLICLLRFLPLKIRKLMWKKWVTYTDDCRIAKPGRVASYTKWL